MLSGRAAGCARGRRPAREPSAPRASLGASPRSPARPRHRPRAPQPGPPVPSRRCCLVLCLACGAAGVLPCLWRRWCSGRRRPLLCEIPEWFPSNVARNSPASISNIEFRTLELQRFRAVSKNDRGKLRATFVWSRSVHRSAARPSGALHAGAAWCCALPVAPLVFCLACGAAGVPGVGGLFCVRYRSGSPAMSHVIPLQVFQILNSERWNCNVFGRSRKMTEGNYVRLLW